MYRLLRFFMQKSERTHVAAPPSQIEPAALGFDLGYLLSGIYRVGIIKTTVS